MVAELERERMVEKKKKSKRDGRVAEIKIAERRESRQCLFPQDVVTVTMKTQRGSITIHHQPR